MNVWAIQEATVGPYHVPVGEFMILLIACLIFLTLMAHVLHHWNDKEK